MLRWTAPTTNDPDERRGSPFVGLVHVANTGVRSAASFAVGGGAMQIAQRTDRSLRVLELPRAVGTRHVDLPVDWARAHEDVVVAFDEFSPANWQAHLVSSDGDVLLAFPWHDHA